MVEQLIPREAMDKYGLDIQLKKQPPQSPDFNVFDCGVFCSMQRMVTAEGPQSLDELINVVGKVWKEYPHYLINDVFLSVQCAMRNSLTVFGDNTVKLQHMNKAALKKRGMLPVSITVPNHLFVKGTMLLDYPDCFLPKEKKGYEWKDEEEKKDDH